MAISLSSPHQLVGNKTIQDIGFQGQLYDTFAGNYVFSAINDQSTAIDFGSFTAASASSNTCKAPAADTDRLIGISVRQFKASTNTSNTVAYNQYDTVPLVNFAPDGIVCLAAEAVTRGDTAVSITAGGGTVGGRNTTNSTSLVAAKGGGNTGNGTVVKDATTPLLTGYQDGIYTITCTVAGTNAATFQVSDPFGRVLGTVAFSGSGASATFANQIKFAVTDGSTDFIVGDGFTFTVNAGRVSANGANSNIRAIWLDTTASGSLGRVALQTL